MANPYRILLEIALGWTTLLDASPPSDGFALAGTRPFASADGSGFSFGLSQKFR
jgi:hypothetical protein